MKAKKTPSGFVVFDGAELRPDLSCHDCTHFNEGGECKPSETPDDLCYPFCGPVCGYWEQRGA
jgi:hypothetical protein